MRSAPGALRRRPNVLARATGLAATTLMAAVLLAWSGPATAAGWDQATAEATLWQLLNGTRANNGLNVLIQHGTLVGIARWRSQDMIQRNYFDHTILGTGYQVYHWYDLNGLAYSLGGENIAWNNGYSDADSPVAAHNGFMSSPGHRANILGASWTHGGVGAWAADGVQFLGALRNPRVYTELFMTAAGSAPPPSGGGGGGGGGSTGGGGWTGGGGGGVAYQPVPAATLPPRVVPAPVLPTSAEPVDGTGQLVHAAGFSLPTRAWAGVDTRGAPLQAPTFASLRVEAPAAVERGVFETVLGALMGFLLG
jgi:uncharacterized protein YkwD